MLPMINKYSAKHDRKINQICRPLVDCLGISVFTYYFIEEDGTFGALTNAIEFHEYYFSENLHLNNPYYSHPSFFHSGHLIAPCSLDATTQKNLENRFKADHYFLTLQASPAKMEGFIFASPHANSEGYLPFISRLELLNKFGSYFKREAKDLIEKLRADRFHIPFNAPQNAPLRNTLEKQKFLKEITGLSKQEQKCLDYFKKGKSAQATGALMGLSQRTVESYFESIKNKLGCSSKYDLLEF